MGANSEPVKEAAVSGTSIRYPYDYEPSIRARSKAYTRGRILQSIVAGELMPFGLHLLLLLSGITFVIAPLLRGLVGASVDGPLLNAFVSDFLFIITYAVFLSGLGLPIAFFTGYVYEHRYGLSTQSVGGWYKDWAKGLFLAGLLGGLLAGGLYLAMRLTPLWWLVGAVAYFVLSAVFIRLAPTFFIKLFFKMDEFSDVEQKARLLEMCRRAGAPEISKVYLLKASEKTKKANAAFTGYGGSKCIILFDTLVDEFHPDETEAVVAHELGHYVNKDVMRGLALQGALAPPVFFLVSLALGWAAGAFGTQVYDVAIYPVLHLAIDGLMFVMAPFVMAMSRRQERQADEFSLKWASRPEALASAFKRLADQGLSDDDPPRIAVLLMMSHPPIRERVAMVIERTSASGNRTTSSPSS